MLEGAVAVVGAGTIGASWAAYFVSAGASVRVFDPALEDSSVVLQKVTEALVALGVQDLPSHLERLSVVKTIEQAVNGVIFVQENAPENVELKRELMQQIDACEGLPVDVVIASSSTALPVSEFQSGALNHPERIVLGHPFNPPHLMPLVEVCGGSATASWALDSAMAFYTRAGKAPVRLRREVPGHIANRLQAAVFREAVYMVQEGICSVKDVDTAMATGPGLRWALMGPIMTYHLGGGDGGISRYFDILGDSQLQRWASLGRLEELSEETKGKVAAGVEEEVQGRSLAELRALRDASLTRILQAKHAGPTI